MYRLNIYSKRLIKCEQSEIIWIQILIYIHTSIH